MADKRRKRRAVRSGSASQDRSLDYDAHLFRSLGCQKFYESINDNAEFIKERALRLDPGEFEEIGANISNRGWGRYVTYPKVASKALVFEFFSNVFPKTEVDGKISFPPSTSHVRGCTVPFDHATINRIFGLAPVETPDCLMRTVLSRKSVQTDRESAEEIRNLLCKPGMDWKRNLSGEPQKIKTSSLNPVARAWAGFIHATISPCSNSTELNIDKALLASCIIRGDPINLGYIIEKELKEFALFKKGVPSFWRYASLIALLCESAGVVAEEDDVTIPPATAINGYWICKKSGLVPPVQMEQPQQEQPVQMEQPQQEQPDEHEPVFNVEDLVGPSAEDFQNLRGRVDMVVANQEQMMAAIEQIRITQEDMRRNQVCIRRAQERIYTESKFERRALYRAVASMSGGQLDPEADIFRAPQPPQPPQQ